MGDLDEAIRDHLELKRRRGADPAEVAREEQEALAPVTRGHAIVTPQDLEQADVWDSGPPRNGASGGAEGSSHDHEHPDPAPAHYSDPAPAHYGKPAPVHDDPGDATQEFRVVLGDSDDWLEDDEG
jgi:hypothetical protein